ncbi:hypothetical protein [Bacillus proteolyticus]
MKSKISFLFIWKMKVCTEEVYPIGSKLPSEPERFWCKNLRTIAMNL